MAEVETDDVPVTITNESDRGYKFTDENGKEEWFPKSQVSFKYRNPITGKATATIPLWLLKNKGW